MNGGRCMLLGIRPGILVYAVGLGLVWRSGACDSSCDASPEPREEDACIFVQNNLRVRSTLSLGSEYAGNITSPVEESFVSGEEIGEEIVTIKPNDNDTVNITRDENTTVVVKVDDSDNATSRSDKKRNVTANVTRNTTGVNIEHKVVKHSGKKPIEVDTRTETEDNQGKRHVVDTKTKIEKTTDKNERADDTGNETEKPKPSPVKPFAKENVTVHKHVLNITRRTNSTHNETQNVTIKEITKTVTVASPFHIASIYMILFVPVIVAWALYYHHGQQMRHYMWLLPFTMCSMSIGQDLVNQSLTLILMAPNAITAIQAVAMGIGALVYSVCDNWSHVRVELWRHVPKVYSWLGVAFFFSIYQLMNHLVYAMSSLSERTVITSLSPLVVLALERLIFSEAMMPMVTFNCKIALALMVVGAMLFSIQSPSFTIDGLGIATLLLLAMVPYRLAQRKFLAEGPLVPLSVLTCIDGFMLGAAALSISAARNGVLWTDFEAFSETSILFMLILSIITFAGLHVCTLAMLRLGSATTYLVFSNIASLATITLGIFFFGDRALGTTLACIGLGTNVASGIWYSIEVQLDDGLCFETKLQQKDSESQGEPKAASTN